MLCWPQRLHTTTCGVAPALLRARRPDVRHASHVRCRKIYAGRQLSVKEGLLASGDIFVDNPDDLRRILDLYPDAKAVDMESAAIAQVCYIKNVPFVCIRVVSDTPGDGGNAAAYENFWQAAPERTFDEVEKLLGLL